MTAAELKKLVKIAQENIVGMEDRPDMETRNSDDLDFMNVSVWELKAALAAAFELGKKSA